MHWLRKKTYFKNLKSRNQRLYLRLFSVCKKVSVHWKIISNLLICCCCCCCWRPYSRVTRRLPFQYLLHQGVRKDAIPFLGLLHFTLDTYEVHTICSQTFFVWTLLLIVYTWNCSPLRNNLLWLQCTSCTVPTTPGRPHGISLVWVSFIFTKLSHNDILRP